MPRQSRLSEEARRTLLCWIEKEAPPLYFCHLCNDLHTWRRMKDYRGVVHYDKCCRRRSGCHSLPHRNNITFPTARVVMNRHLYGEAHGPPVKVLRYTVKGPCCSNDGDVLKQSWRALLIDDELYLEASVQLYHDKGRARILREHLNNDRLVCCHGGELDRVSDSSDLFVTGSLKSCRYCFTDYRVHVQWHPRTRTCWGPKGWVISLTRWHQLGSCRSPRDTKWFNYATGDCQRITAPRINSCEAGMVYRKWRSQDAEGAGVTGKGANLADDDGRSKSRFLPGRQRCVFTFAEKRPGS
ncbi:hypothetical protein VTK56DRAFT_9643 [Thermocarpiscus australiensis]